MHSTKKSIVAQKIYSDNAITKENAATKIQAYYRGYIVRRQRQRTTSVPPTGTDQSTAATVVKTNLQKVDGAHDSNRHNDK